jgi:hypothetical protein
MTNEGHEELRSSALQRLHELLTKNMCDTIKLREEREQLRKDIHAWQTGQVDD